MGRRDLLETQRAKSRSKGVGSAGDSFRRRAEVCGCRSQTAPSDETEALGRNGRWLDEKLAVASNEHDLHKNARLGGNQRRSSASRLS